MTFLPECVFSRQKLFLLIKWVHNDFMYVRFDGMRNTKTWSKSNLDTMGENNTKTALKGCGVKSNSMKSCRELSRNSHKNHKFKKNLTEMRMRVSSYKCNNFCLVEKKQLTYARQFYDLFGLVK